MTNQPSKVNSRSVTLERIDEALSIAWHESSEQFEARLDCQSSHAAQWLSDVLTATVALLKSKPRGDNWGCFFAIDPQSRQLVGACGFKDAPTPSGEVEIAYFTFPPFEQCGYATAMAGQLVAKASEHGATTVIAHTLPEVNASGRLLQKLGFRCVGEVVDPEDGPVWRWERSV